MLTSHTNSNLDIGGDLSVDGNLIVDGSISGNVSVTGDVAAVNMNLSGNEVVNGTTNLIGALSLNSVAITATAAEINKAASLTGKNVSVTTTPLTVTAASHANKYIILDKATGITATLPAASGSGNIYQFFIKTTASGGSYIIKVANSSDVMTGYSVSGTDNSNATLFFNTAVDSDTITMNGTSTGGIAGARIVLRDIATNLFSVECYSNASGTEATPFSATV